MSTTEEDIKSNLNGDDNNDNYIQKGDPLWARLLLKFMGQVVFVIAVTWASLYLTERKDKAIIQAQGEVKSLLMDRKLANDTLVAAIKAFYDSAFAAQKTIDQLKIDVEKSKLTIYADSIEAIRQLENKMVEMQAQLKADLKKIDEQFKNELLVERKKVSLDSIRDINKDRMRIIRERLSLFYWPILTRLEKNKSVLAIYDSSFLLNALEQEVLVENHKSIVNTLEEYSHLAYADKYLNAEIKHYLAYVSVYEAMQAGGFPGDPSFIGGETTREQFYKMIRARTYEFQRQYDSLINNDTLTLNRIALNHIELYKQDTINYDSSMRKVETRAKLNNCFKKYFITQARTEASYLEPLDDSIALYLKDSELGEWVFIEISYYTDNGNSQNRSKTMYSKKLKIGESTSFYFPEIGSYYKVTANRVYKGIVNTGDSKRKRGDFTVRKWKRGMVGCDLKDDPQIKKGPD